MATEKPGRASVWDGGRDPRLDFFRGIALFIIYIAHIPGNWYAAYIPARFGLSDAADQFVFCSGFAAAIAFGGTFRRAGFAMGTARIALRCWQLYLAHLMIFFAVALVMVVGNRLFAEPDYVQSLNLMFFFDHTRDALLGLMTLHYVPNYFDIMPMYMVILAMVPAMMALARVTPWLAIGASVVLYVIVWNTGIGLPAEMPSSDVPDRKWFFNPLAWQIIFFTGFALSAGWIRPPPTRAWGVVAAATFVVVAWMFSHRGITYGVEWIAPVHDTVRWYMYKMDYGILRWVHFLCLAYLSVSFVNRFPHLLDTAPARATIRCGQQALSVFAVSMVLARIAGMAIDQTSDDLLTILLINLAGLVVLYGVARVVRWYKRTPWKRAPAASPKRAPDPAETPERRDGRRFTHPQHGLGD